MYTPMTQQEKETAAKVEDAILLLQVMAEIAWTKRNYTKCDVLRSAAVALANDCR